MKLLVRLLLYASIGIMTYTYLHYGETGLLPDLPGDLMALYWTFVYSLGLGISIDKIHQLLSGLLPWRKYFTGRFIVGLVANAVTGVLLLLTFGYLYALILTEIDFGQFVLTHQESAVKLAILLFFMFFIYNIVDFTFYSYNEYAVGQIETVKLEREHMELQFEALKTQLSPHYLFNCLNTISSLIDKNAEYAETFIRRLVQTYQYILESKDKKLISLAEEIDFVKAYQFLLKVRFGDAMKINFELSDEVMKTQIPPLTIQILIENAVKHNEISEEDPLEIEIKMDNGDFITVKNDKTAGLLDDVSSFKIGLENIQKRYQYFTSKPIKIIDQHNFEVKLPLIPAA